jgi:hypothetical protein
MIILPPACKDEQNEVFVNLLKSQCSVASGDAGYTHFRWLIDVIKFEKYKD